MSERVDHNVFHSLIIFWLEAKLITNGGVNTSEACRVFKITRQNMMLAVKKWKQRSVLPVYDSSEKKYVLNRADIQSVLFRDYDEADKFIKSIEYSIRVTQGS